MIANPAVGIKDLLVTAGVGVFAATSGWGIYVGQQPSDLDTVVTVYNSGGKNADPKFLLQEPSIQVRIRGAANGYVAAYDKAAEVQDELLGIPSQVVNGDQWDGITAIGDINNLGFDESQRPMFSLNFSLIVEPASGTNRISL